MADADLVTLHREALDLAAEFVADVTEADLARDTPCEGWDLADLLAHMIGQHVGFALAVTDGDAPAEAYAPVPFTAREWARSVGEITAAFAAADPERPVREVELAPTPLPLRQVVGAQLLDTVVHTWDLAQSLGREFVPPDRLLEPVAAIAAAIPDQAFGPGRAFGEPFDSDGSTWAQTLARLGRTPLS